MIRFNQSITFDLFQKWVEAFQNESGKEINQKIIARVFRKMELEYSNFNVDVKKENLKNTYVNWKNVTIECAYIADGILEFKDALKKLAWENIQENMTTNITTLNDERLRKSIENLFDFQKENIRYQTGIGTKFTNKNTLQDVILYVKEIGFLDDLGIINWWAEQYRPLILNRDIPLNPPVCTNAEDEDNNSDELIELITKISEEIAKKEVSNLKIKEVAIASINENLEIEKISSDKKDTFNLNVKVPKPVKISSFKISEIRSFLEDQEPFIISDNAKIDTEDYTVILKNQEKIKIPKIYFAKMTRRYLFVGEESKLDLQITNENFAEYIEKLKDLGVERTQPTSAGKKYTFSGLALEKFNKYKEKFEQRLKKDFPNDEINFLEDSINIIFEDEKQIFVYIYAFAKY